MSGSQRNNEKEGEGSGDGGGGWSTFWKVAGAAAAVAGAAAVAAGGADRIQEEAKQKQVAVGAGAGGGSSDGFRMQTKESRVWTPPKEGWLKLNVDGSLLRNIQSAGCGGVLRDNCGNWILGFAQKLNPSSREDETEKRGILKGLEWAKENGFTKVEVESDNQGIVEKVNSGRGSKDRLIISIRELLGSPNWETTLTWIPRTANRVADKLADIGCNLTSYDDLHEYHICPPSCTIAFNNDSLLL